MNHRFGRPTARQIILYTLLMAAALAVVVLYLAGGNKVFEGGGDEPEYTYQDTVTLPMHSVRTLNPATSTDADTYYIAPLLYGSLFKLDPSRTPQLDLAEISEKCGYFDHKYFQRQFASSAGMPALKYRALLGR